MTPLTQTYRLFTRQNGLWLWQKCEDGHALARVVVVDDCRKLEHLVDEVLHCCCAKLLVVFARVLSENVCDGQIGIVE